MAEESTFVQSSNPDFPLKITPLAAQKLAWALETEEGLGDNPFIRVSVVGGGCSGFQHKLDFESELDLEEDIETTITIPTLPIDGSTHTKTARLAVDSFSALYLKGVELDFIHEKFKEGFKFSGGQIKGHCGCGSSVKY